MKTRWGTDDTTTPWANIPIAPLSRLLSGFPSLHEELPMLNKAHYQLGANNYYFPQHTELDAIYRLRLNVPVEEENSAVFCLF